MRRSTPVKRKRGGGVTAVLARPPKRQRAITDSLTSPPKARSLPCTSLCLPVRPFLLPSCATGLHHAHWRHWGSCVAGSLTCRIAAPDLLYSILENW